MRATHLVSGTIRGTKLVLLDRLVRDAIVLLPEMGILSSLIIVKITHMFMMIFSTLKKQITY
jgi:hypothetical protein